MFAYTGMTEAQVLQIRADHHVYMTNDGRISIAGVNTKNVQYIAQSIHAVTKWSSTSNYIHIILINILIRINLNVKWYMVAEEALHHKAYRQTMRVPSARLQ